VQKSKTAVTALTAIIQAGRPLVAIQPHEWSVTFPSYRRQTKPHCSP
jgi:hypothetical protein